MKQVIIATTILMSLLAQPAAAQERDASRGESLRADGRLERLLQDRRTLERLESPSHHRSRSDIERRYPRQRRRDLDYRSPVRRDSDHLQRRRRSVFGINGDRSTVIFSPDRTVIIQQRHRHERQDVRQVNPGHLPYPPSSAATIRRQQQSPPRLLHGQTISPFVAQIYAQATLDGHEGPSTVYPVITRFATGQVVTATQTAGGADGAQWYLVASGQGQYAWVRGDRLLMETR